MRTAALHLAAVMVLALQAGVARAAAPLPAGAALKLGEAGRKYHRLHTVLFKPDGKAVVIACSSGVAVHDAATGKLLKSGGTKWSPTGAMAVSRDGKLVAAAARDSTIRLLDGATLAEKHSLAGHKSPVTGLAFAKDGRLASSDQSGVIILWNTATGKTAGRIPAQEGRVKSVAFLPSGKTLAASVRTGREDVIRLLDPATGKLRLQLEKHGKDVAAMSVSRDGQVIGAACDDWRGRLWDVAGGKLLGDLRVGHAACLTASAFAPDGRGLVCGDMAGRIVIWNVEQRSDVHRYESRSWVTSLDVSPGGRMIASAHRDGTVYLWKVPQKVIDALKPRPKLEDNDYF